MLQLQTILQHFYKLLMWLTSNWFSFRPTINITFLFTNNHSHFSILQNSFVKKFVYMTLSHYSKNIESHDSHRYSQIGLVSSQLRRL